MFKAGIGHSDDIDPPAAVREALDQALEPLDGLPPHLGILFTSMMRTDFQALVDTITTACPGIRLIGGTTDGEFTSVLGPAEDSVALALIHADGIRMRSGLGLNLNEDTGSAVQQALAPLLPVREGEDRICLAFPDGISCFSAPVVETLNQSLPASVPLFGGAAADHYQFTGTYQFLDGQVATNALPLLVCGGNLRYGIGVAGGWKPIGRKGRITAARGNVIETIDGKPAIGFLEHYLGPELKETPQFPLAIFDEAGNFRQWRPPLRCDRETGHIICVGQVPGRGAVQIAETGRTELLDAAGQAIREASQNYPGEAPRLALLISCTSRRKILGTRIKEETAALAQAVPETLPYIGAFTYGEIAPFAGERKSSFLNTTFCVLLLGDR